MCIVLSAEFRYFETWKVKNNMLLPKENFIARPEVKIQLKLLNHIKEVDLNCILKLHVRIMNYVYLKVGSRVFFSAQTSFFTLAGMSKLHEFKKENMHKSKNMLIKRRKMTKCFKMSYPCNFF